MVLQQLCRKPQRIRRKNRPVGPDLQRQLLVVGNLTETCSLNQVIHLAHRRVDRVHRNKPDAQVAVEVLIRRNIPTAALQAHLHVDASALGDRADVHIRIQNLDIRIRLDHARRNHARSVRAQIKSLRALAIQFERNLFQVQDDVGSIFHDARNGLELVQHTFYANGRNRRSLDRREQRAPQRISDGRTKAALKRLRGKLTVKVGQALLIDGETLGLLKTSPKHCWILSFVAARGILRG